MAKENKFTQMLKDRSVLFIMLGMFLLVLVGYFGSWIFWYSKEIPEEDKPLLGAALIFSEGDVEFMQEDEDRWIEAKVGDSFEETDSIRTGESSRAVIELDNGDVVRLDSESEIVLESMDPDEITIQQNSGQVYSRIRGEDGYDYSVVAQGVETVSKGTAYTVNSDTEKKTVNVLVYDSAVDLSVGDSEEEVTELKKAVVDADKKEIEVKDMSEEEYKGGFAGWNRDKDKEVDLQCNEEEGPSISITSPENGSSTEADSVAVVGQATDESGMKKIVVNGQIYTSKDENGKGFNPSDGTFDVNVGLAEGENTITVTAYDIYWNSSSASVKVTRTSSGGTPPETPPVTPPSTQYFYITGISSPAAGKIQVSWDVSGYDLPKGFKVVRSTSPNPVYPGNDYVYASDSSARSTKMTGVPAGTYYVRVCIYTDSGCMYYTDNATVAVEGTPPKEYATGVTISVTDPVDDGNGSYKVTVSWSPVGGSAPDGYKVCYAEHSSPTYPNDTCKYMGADATSLVISGLKSGKTYYFRVGIYRGGYCDPYSEAVSKTTP